MFTDGKISSEQMLSSLSVWLNVRNSCIVILGLFQKLHVDLKDYKP